ncbi:hypothetical protein GCM10009839_90720 [Catenulispora yoronensis]|uniref:Lipoprotein n=1 Tax=Catenulispora yoronensis TaxID=450799 RepID=A0ABP5H7H7_9ACTN
MALASSVILLGGCASSGSVGGKSALGGSSDKSTGAPALGDSSTSKGSSDKSASADKSSASSDKSSADSSDSSSDSLGDAFDDPGCKAAMDAASNALNGLSAGDPSSAKKTLQDIAAKMHEAAGKSKKPDAASAINKVGDDYAKMANSLGSGTPDMGSLSTDAQAMGTACGG